MKKFLMYCGLYILITFSTAFGVVLVTKPTNANNNQNHIQEDIKTEDNTALTYIVDNFSNLQSMRVNAGITLATGGKNITIDANVGMDMSNGFENLSVNGTANVKIDNQLIEAQFTYIDSQLYLSALNGNYKIETTNLMSSVKQIITLLDIKMPDIGIDFENIDTNSLLALLDDIKETKTDTEVILTINLPYVGEVTLVCDLNYSIKSIKIPTTEVKGITLGVEAQVDYPKDYVVEKPDIEPIDLTHVFNLAEGLINYIKNDMLGLDIALDYNGTTYTGNLTVDLNNNNIRLSTSYKDYPINVYLIDDTLYAEVANLYVKFDLNNIESVATLLKDQFGIDIPLDKIGAVLKTIQDKKVDLSQLNLNNMDLSKIDLSILEDFEYNDGIYDITIKNIGKLKIHFENHNFSSVKLISEKINANINSFEPNPIQLTKDVDSYADINLLVPVANAIINTTKLNNHFGTIHFSYKDYQFDVDYRLNIDNGLTASISTSIYDIPVNVVLNNEKLYINVMDVNIVAGLNDIDLIKQFVTDKFKVEETELNSQETIDKVMTIVEEILKSDTLIITKLESSETGINLNVLNKYNVNIDYSNTITGLKLKLDDIDANITLNSNNDSFDVIIDESKYVTINELITLENNIEEYIKNGKYYANVTLNYKDYYIYAVVGYENNSEDYLDNLSLQAYTTIYNKEIKVTLLNKIVYIEVDGLNLKFEISKLNEVLDFVEKNFGIKVDINEMIEKSKSLTKDFDITTLLNNLNVKLTSNQLSIINDWITANIDLDNYKLNGLDITYNDLTVNANIISSMPALELNDNYFEISDLLPLIESTLNTINSGRLEGQLELIYKNFSLNLKYKVQLDPLTVYVSTRLMGLDINLYYKDNNVYVMVGELYFKVTPNDIEYIIKVISDKLGITIDKNTIIEKIKSTDIEELLSKIHLSDIKDLYADGHVFKVNTFGVKVDVTYDTKINSFMIKYNDVKVQGQLTKFSDDVKMPLVNTKAFESVDYLIELINNLYNNLSEKHIYINGSINLNNFEIPVNAYVDFDNQLKLTAQAKVLGKNININMLDNVVYADIDGLKVYYDLDNISSLLDNLRDNFDIDLNTNINLNDITKKLFFKNITKTTQANGYTLKVKVAYDEKEIVIDVNFNNDNQLENIQIGYNTLNVMLNTQFDKTLDINVNASEYKTNVNDIVDIIKPISNILNSTSLEINGIVKVDLLGANQTINIDHIKLDYSDINNIIVNAKLTMYNQSVDVIYSDSTLYVKVDNVKAYIKINELNDLVDWINDTFNANIDISSLNKKLTKDDIEDMLSKFVLGEKLRSIEKTLNGVMINLNTYQKVIDEVTQNITQEIVVDYNDTLNQIIVNHEKVYAEIRLSNYNNTKVVVGNENDYVHYTKYTRIVSNVYNYIKAKQYSVNASANVYNGEKLRFNGNIDLDVNITDKLQMAGYAHLAGEKTLDISLNYWNQYLYVNYNNLKLKMCENDLKEVMVIGLKLLGVNPDMIPFLKDAVDDLDNINFDSLSTLIPGINMSNPLSMMTMIKGISFDNDNLQVVIDGSQITNNPNAKAMTLNINFVNDNLNTLSLNNIFTGVTENEYFNLDINFKDTHTVEAVNDNGYIDISGTNEFIKAIINTAELNYYEISGNLNIVGSLVGIDINWKVPLNVKVKLDENRMPELMMTIGEIPTMVGVNNDVPYEFGDTESGSGRMLYVYYKDSNVYFYRTEYVDIMFGAGKRQYEKKLMVDIDEVLNNPLTYLQYGVGFTDTIIEQIQKSLDKSIGHTPNLGNIFKQFSVSENKTNLTVVLNMHELTNDELMGDMTIGLGVVNNDSTNNKNYIGNATFGLNMPLASVFTMDLKSNDLQLINIGKELDFGTLYDYINNYTYLKGESWEASKGKWSKSSEIVHTINFVSNCGDNISPISAKPDTPITLPTYTTPIVIDDGEKVITRTFLAWCTNAEFKKGSEYTTDKMPSRDMTLYGKWYEDIQYYRYINFVTNSNDTLDSIKALENSSIALPTLTQKEETVGTTTTTYEFTGWYTDEATHNAFNGSKMPITDTTLYAGWKVIKVEETRKLSVYDNDTLLYSCQIKVGDNIDLSSISKINNNTLLYTDRNYTTAYDNTFVMPENDVTLYVRNQYTLKVVSAKGNTVDKTYTLWQGESISSLIPSQESQLIVDDGTQTAQYTYTFNGYDNYTTTMPNANIEIVANWTESVKYYYTVTFNTDLNYIPKSCVAGSKYKTAPGSVSSIRVLDGETFTTNNNLTCQVWATAIAWGVSYNYTCSGWSTSKPTKYDYKDGGGDSTFTINGSDMTLYVVWKKN